MPILRNRPFKTFSSSPLQSLTSSPSPMDVQSNPPNSPEILGEQRQPGMEKGFALSPMGNLVIEYNQQQDEEISIFMRTTSVISEKSLGISDILDRGVNLEKQNIVSTMPEVYSVFPREGKTPIEDVAYLFDNVPHLRKLWPRGYNTATDWIPHIMRAPEYLERAFPDRQPEAKPSTIYYSAEGERKEITLSERTSRGAGSDFIPPPVEQKRSKGKGKDSTFQPSLPTEIRVETGPQQSGTRSPMHWNLSDMHQGMLGSEVPYKDSGQFFVPISRILFTEWLQWVGTEALETQRVKREGRVSRLSLANKPCLKFLKWMNNLSILDLSETHHRIWAIPLPSNTVMILPLNPFRTESLPARLAEERVLLRPGDQQRTRREEDQEAKQEGMVIRRIVATMMEMTTTRRGFHPPRRARWDDWSPSRSRRDPPPPPLGPPNGGGGGGGGGGRGGGGNGGNGGIDQRFPYIAPGAPYGLIVPTIEPKLKPEALPEWDGDHDTAIDYFWEVSEMASLMGWLPKTLGFWLPSRLKRGSAIQTWFSTLPAKRQAAMREHYLTYLQVIKDRYLGQKWQLKENIKFEQQSFRQKGHEDETPQMFLGRRVRAVRMLANSDDGGPLEVFLVMRKAPIKWSTILVLENIQSTEELYDKVNEHDDSLVDAARGQSHDALTVGNLASTLRRLGYGPNAVAPARSFRRVNLAETDDAVEMEARVDMTNLDASSSNGILVPDADHLVGKGSQANATKRTVYKVQIEEIEDEYWEQEARMPKAIKGILEEEPEDSTEAVDEETMSPHKESQIPDVPIPPPLTEPDPIVIRPKRSTKPGDSAIGVSVLAVKGWIGSMNEDPIDLRLDSCADITLVSEKYHKGLRSPPPIREGHRMNLAQLTDQGTNIKGFTKLRVFMPSTSGEILEMEAEAYVVKGMSVPVLLGEDFQLNYELGVEATGVESFVGRAEAHVLASNLTVHSRKRLKAKEHRRARARRRRRVLRNGVEGRTIRAAQDYRIKAHECCNVRVEGDIKEDKEWLVERNLLANSEDSFFSVPNTLLSARKPIVPVSNMSERPRFVRKGEILGSLIDPQEYFDKPQSKEIYSEMESRTAMITAIIQAKSESDACPEKEEGPTREERKARVRTDFGTGVPPSEENARKGVHIRDEQGRVPERDGALPANKEEAEDYGPKTAAMPDDTIYSSEDIEKLLDVGSLPDGLKPKAWEMLRRRVKAFGFDGRLGRMDAKARIRVKEGDALEGQKSGFAVTRSQGQNSKKAEEIQAPSSTASTDNLPAVETGGGVDGDGVILIPSWSIPRAEDPHKMIRLGNLTLCNPLRNTGELQIRHLTFTSGWRSRSRILG
ncbi:hypothetical protein B0H13DRAFT_1913575 [Mycena leptocephala]|nr:hypothetical protein B0H13DRAFT_1913575 [Mycena leptocephala]